MRRFLISFVLLLLIPFSAFAAELDEEAYNDYLSQYDLSFFDKKLDEDTREYLRDLEADTFDFSTISSMTFDDALGVLKKIIKGSAVTPVKGAVSVVLYIIISSLIRSIKADDYSSASDAFSTVSALIICSLLVANIGKTISLCATSLGVAGDFIFAFIPIFCAIVLASGNAVTSFSTNAFLLMLSQGISFISSNIFMPLINSFLAIGICSGIRAELHLERLISTLKRVIIWCVTFISGAYVSVLSIKTTVAARADILGVRSARFVINSVVPVIGASVSEGLLSIQSYSSLIKSSVGVVGIIAVSLVFLPSVAEVLMWRIVLSLCGAISDVFDDRSVSLVVTSFSDTMLLINVILVLSAVTTIISIGLLIAAGG